MKMSYFKFVIASSADLNPGDILCRGFSVRFCFVFAVVIPGLIFLTPIPRTGPDTHILKI